MQITVTSGDKQVHIKIKGHSRAKLQAAEDTARRLLIAAPAPEPKRAVGFSTTSNTERADSEE